MFFLIIELKNKIMNRNRTNSKNKKIVKPSFYDVQRLKLYVFIDMYCYSDVEQHEKTVLFIFLHF